MKSLILSLALFLPMSALCESSSCPSFSGNYTIAPHRNFADGPQRLTIIQPTSSHIVAETDNGIRLEAELDGEVHSSSTSARATKGWCEDGEIIIEVTNTYYNETTTWRLYRDVFGDASIPSELNLQKFSPNSVNPAQPNFWERFILAN